MSHYGPLDYFDLSLFDYPSLFPSSEPVWKALKNLNSFLLGQSLGKKEGDIHPTAVLIDPETISIGKNTVVEAGALIKGPCIIGDNCQIRQGAYIRGSVLVSSGCVVGHTTEVKNSIFFPKAQAGHFAYIGDSILGNKVNLGAGVKLANLRLDNKSICVVCKENKVDTGMRKLGAILGDGVQLGCNAVTNPGTFFGKHSFCHPCQNASGVIPQDHVVRGESLPIVEPSFQRVQS